MAKINIKTLSEDAYIYLNKNLDTLTKLVKQNDTNDFLFSDESELKIPQPMFVEKNLQIEDFELINNPDSKDSEIDFKNGINIYNSLNSLPKHILSDDRFWLWLHLEKFYLIVKNMMTINSVSTIKDHWFHGPGVRRGLFFGVLSRLYFRVELSIDENLEDSLSLTKWVFENPLRFREMSWRTFSSQRKIIRGALKGEKRALEEIRGEDNKSLLYNKVAKYVSSLGSVMLLDAMSENDIENLVYKKTKELLNAKEA
jgi:hypothetical protein